MSEELPAVKSGQTWRLPGRGVVRVTEVDGDHVSGSLTPAAIASGGAAGAPVAGVSAAFEGHRSEFTNAELLPLRWRVSFVAPAAAVDHPTEDPVFRALSDAEAVVIDGRSSPRIESKTPPADSKIRLDQAEYVAEVTAESEEEAKRVIRDAVEPHGQASGFAIDQIV